MASNRVRTKLCRNFALGHCSQGNQCRYLHSTNIPMSPMYPVVPSSVPFMNLQSPGATWAISPPMNAPWGITSPTVQYPEGVSFNWTYASSQDNSSTEPPHPPQFRPLSWRTTLCRHFIKNQGWCPMGNDCGYIHDLSLAAHATNDVRYPDASRSGRGRAGNKQSHCWAYVQGLCRVRDCPYLHPASIELFIPHTPCLAWPNCTKGYLCAYKHPEPLNQKAPEAQSTAIPQVQAQPPSPVTAIPPGSVQVHGTTYFPMQTQPPVLMPPLPLPAVYPPPQLSPHYTWTQSPLAGGVPSGYSPYSAESVSFLSPVYEARPHLPVSIAPHPTSIYEDPHRYFGMRPPIPVSEVDIAGTSEVTTASNYQDATAEEEFPYRPPNRQRVGHARRISVTLKSKEDSDASGLMNQGTTARRESWMGHGQRDSPNHRSWPWAPDSVAIPTTAPPHRTQFVM